MLEILLIVFIFCVIAYAVWNYYLYPAMNKRMPNKKEASNVCNIVIAAAVALIIRIILGACYKGHSTDMTCFIGWSDSIFKNGIGNFYSSSGFHDYPPGYMYVLYIIGAVRNLFSILESKLLYVLIKLPAMICDILAGLLIYKIAKKKFSDGISTMIASLYLFNPAAVLNCSLWGQVDAVYTFLILLMIYLISENKMIASYFSFAACILIKPQAFILTPVLIAGIVENVFLRDFTWEKFWKNLVGGLIAIAAIFMLALPFGIGNVFEQYKLTLQSYQHCTVNAFNLWGAIGKNWADLIKIDNIIGYLLLAAIVAYSIYLFFKSKHPSKFYFVGAILVFFTYMFSTKMHERYAFPAMVLLLAAIVWAGNKHNFIMYIAVTMSQLINAAWVLFVYEKDMNAYFQSPHIIYASILNLALVVYIIYCAQRLYANNELIINVESEKQKKLKQSKSNKQISNNKTTGNAEKKKLSAVLPKITRIDIIIMAAITVIYSCVALYDLGDNHAPETEYMVSDAAATIDLGSEQQISEIKFFLGSYELNSSRTLKITAKDNYNRVIASENLAEGAVFYWNEESMSAKARYITLDTDDSDLSVKEIAVLDRDGNVITPVSSEPKEAAALFDEQDEIPERSSFRNGTYFDEIYHARTGYEFLHGLSAYEWTHPPLGKVFIAAGIKLFGMNPFGWRIAGTVFGIMMIPLIYLFAKKMMKKPWIAAVTCLLLTFDFMHFAQTRIATIDVYVTFFIILMYYFMYKYYSTSIYETSYKKDFAVLALCGISMGLGIASKWTGVYAAVFGLLPLWIIAFCRKYKDYKYACLQKNDKKFKDSIEKYTLKTIIWCVIFFVIVPAVIYYISYIPYMKAPDSVHGYYGFKSFIDNQPEMIKYHSGLVAEHPYSSNWYEWILMKRPIWYYSGTVSSTLKEGISAFGNPLVWWMGVPAFVYMVYLMIAKKDKNSLFLVISYMAQLLPWIFVRRLTFIYHYFPCVPFIVLMIGYAIKNLYDNAKNKKALVCAVCGYVLLVIVLFVMFYPVISGQPCEIDYAKDFLKWFNSWVLL